MAFRDAVVVLLHCASQASGPKQRTVKALSTPVSSRRGKRSGKVDIRNRYGRYSCREKADDKNSGVLDAIHDGG